VPNAQAAWTSAQHTAQTPPDSFDEDHIIIRFAPSVIDTAESTLSKGESLEAKLNRTSRLGGLRSSLRLDTLERVFKHSRAFGAGTTVGSRVAARHRGAFLVAIRGTRDVLDVLDEVRSHPDVEQAQLNYIYIPDLVPTDPQYPAQYAHALTDAELGWDIETGDPSVAMAIVGTGVELLHPDLAANIWENTGEIAGNSIDDDLNGYVDDINGWDFAADDNDPTPVGSTHETEVAGVAGAVTNNAEGIAGVAWDCRIMPLQINYTTVDVANAIDYAADNGARVINMSFGSYDPGKYGPDTIVEDAVIDAFASGVVLVATAGNNSIDDMRYPAALDDVIAVASTTSADQRSSFSNYGSWVTVAAPGSAILSTSGPAGYNTVNGTSFAAPYVAGIAALLASADGSLSPTSVRLRIEYSVDKIDSDLYIGTGRVNVGRALSLDSDPDLFALISSPRQYSLGELVQISGTALGEQYVLEHRSTPDPSWVFLAGGGEVINGELGVLDAGHLDGCHQEVRLTTTRSGESDEHLVTLSERPAIVEGGVYGDYRVTELALDPSAPHGNYTFFAAAGNDGFVTLRLDGAPVATLSYIWQTTVGAGQDFTFEFPGVVDVTVTRDGSGTSNLYNMPESIFDGLETMFVGPIAQPAIGGTIVEGLVYGDYLVTELRANHPRTSPGTYTFFAAAGNDGFVTLRLDGAPVATLSYIWQTTVGAGQDFTFEFPCALDITVTKAGSGTINLYGMPESIFDGVETVVVPEPAQSLLFAAGAVFLALLRWTRLRTHRR
jgi:subtilisin family serine protease